MGPECPSEVWGLTLPEENPPQPCELDAHSIVWRDATNAGSKKGFHWSEPHQSFVELDDDGLMSNMFKFQECKDEGLVIYDPSRKITLILPFSFQGPAPVKYRDGDKSLNKPWVDLMSLMAFREGNDQEFTVQR